MVSYLYRKKLQDALARASKYVLFSYDIADFFVKSFGANKRKDKRDSSPESAPKP